MVCQHNRGLGLVRAMCFSLNDWPGVQGWEKELNLGLVLRKKKGGTTCRAPSQSDHQLLAIAGGLWGRVFVLARGHGNDEVLVFFAVGFRDAKKQFVLMNAELRDLADGQQRWMLFVRGPDAIDHVV